MRRMLILLSAFLIWSPGSNTFAQDKPQDPKPTSEGERPKNAVEQMLEEAKQRGELILGTCLKDCGDSPTTEGIESGRALELTKPIYPAIARAANASGEVRVQIIIDVDGTVIAAAAISGHPLLQAASVTAARNTRFSPTKVNGQPVKVTGVLSYNFTAQ